MLALSLAAHLYLVWVFGHHAGWVIPPTPSQPLSVTTLSVSLIKQNSKGSVPTASSTAPAGYHRRSDRPENQRDVLSHPALPQPDRQGPVLEIFTQSEPYYFQQNELEEKPRVLVDAVPELSFSLPGTTTLSTVLRLFINEQGNIDRVVVEESDIPEKARYLLTDTFADMKFQPGKIDNIPVKSQLRIEALFENTVPAD